ncbi:MAG: hypothetical protein LBK99_21250 [Opitutaceae bacterium]|jgi:hypothetical protein|nr:hypothetical protein [Opitutaceae bacterium]
MLDHMLEKLLTHLERIIDEDHVARVRALHCHALSHAPDAPRVCKVNTTLPDNPFTPVPHQATHNDHGLMLYNQLLPLLTGATLRDHQIYSIRPNYGVGTLPSFFGARSSFADENQMPWCEHLPDKDAVRRAIENGPPPLHAGFGPRILETCDYYARTLARHPRLQRTIAIYHPDFQGPFDTAHLLYGTDLYYDMCDDPGFVHQLLATITDTWIALMDQILPHMSEPVEGHCHHWDALYPGHIVLRNDTAVTLSPDMYNEFVRPYDERILRHYHGGSMHYCGARLPWLPDMLQKTGHLHAMNFGRVPGLAYGRPFIEEVRQRSAPRHIAIVGYNMTLDEFNDLRATPGLTPAGLTFQIDIPTPAQATAFLQTLAHENDTPRLLRSHA